MLLTLAASSFAARLTAGRSKPARSSRSSKAKAETAEAVQPLALEDLPRFTRNELGLFGLNLSTDLLVGADLKKLDAVRDAADKASCPCLVLVERTPQELATEDEALGAAAVDRLTRVVQAASRLGCNSVAVTIEDAAHADAFDFAAERVRMVLAKAEKLEVNVLLAPPQPSAISRSNQAEDSLTLEPDRLTELIKKVGGFRIGTFPDFQTASKSPDALLYLRRLVPYAAAVSASVEDFAPASAGSPPAASGTKNAAKPSPKAPLFHGSYNLHDYAKAVESVGFTQTLAIDYRGSGDAVQGVTLARQILESALGLEVVES